MVQNLGDLISKYGQNLPCHSIPSKWRKKRGEISCNKVECSIIKIEESYGPPAVKGSACEFDPIVVASLFPLDMHCTLSK